MEKIDNKELNEILVQSYKQHIQKVDSPIPKHAALKIDADLHLIVNNKTLHKGLYFIRAGEYKKTDRIYIYTLKITNEFNSKKKENNTETINFKAFIEPIKLNNRHLELNELLANLAIQDAINSENKELLQALLYTFYGLETYEVKREKQDIQTVTKRIKALDKISNPKTIQQITNNQEWQINTGGKTENNIYTLIKFDEPNPELFTGLAEPIYSTIASMYDAGRRNMTYSDIAKYTYNVNKPTNNQIHTVINNVKDMAQTLIDINYSREIRGAENIKDYQHTENLLYAEFDTFITANGKTTGGIKIIKEPILIRHAKETKQFTTVPIELLNTASKKVSSTDTNILIREYLLRETEHRRKTKNKHMTYKSIFNSANIIKTNSTEKKRLRKVVKSYLEVFKDYKRIKDYKEYKTGRSYTGIELIF